MQTNKLTIDIDYHALNQAFVFLQFEWQKSDGQKSQWANSYHLDDILAEYRAEACLFQYSRFAYVMLKRDDIDSIDTIISALRNKADYDAIRIQVVKATPEIEEPCITGKWLTQILF